MPKTSRKLKKKSEIIRDLEEQILARYKRIDALQIEINTLNASIESLKLLGDEEAVSPLPKAKEPIVNNFPGYPEKSGLLDKLRYLEDLTLKVWSKAGMSELIEKAEGKRKATSTLKHFSQKLHQLVKHSELINLKYNNSNRYSYYTTRPEWIANQDDEGRKFFCVLPKHAPGEGELANLSKEQMNPENIVWSGIK